MGKFAKYRTNFVKFNSTVIDACVWMQELPEFASKKEYWYMHPVVFLWYLRGHKTGWAHSAFAELLGRVESKNDYTAYNVTKSGHPVPHYNTKLTSMTIRQVMDSQDNKDMFATGRFQIIPNTLKLAVKQLKLDINALYDETMQDTIFDEFLIKIKRPAFINYLEGDGSVEDAIYDWAKEFASAGVREGKEISRSKTEFETNPDGSFKKDKHGRKIRKRRWAKTEGVSYYSGDGFNKFHIMPDKMIHVLEESKNAAVK